MDKPEFRVERGPETEPEPFAIGMAKLLEREGRTVAAAELRRLHEAHDWQYKMAGERLRRVEKLEAQRDALLEALELARLMLIAHGEKHAKFDAAIKAVEEGK